MSRRSFTIALPAWLFSNSFAAGAYAQSSTPLVPNGMSVVPGGAGIPGAPAQPWRDTIPLPGDEETCFIFVQLTCPYCAQFHTPIWNWAQSLPPNWRAHYVPVLVQGADSFIQLKVFTAAQIAEPRRLGEFMRVAYFSLQQQGMPINDPSTWRSILAASGYDLDAFADVWQTLIEDEPLIEPVIQLQKHYGIAVTPTVIVGGKYAVTPDNTNGNEALFIQLLSGMLSKAAGVA